jgi:hypothetical protein
VCSLRGFTDKEAPKAHEEEEAQEDAEGDALAATRGPLVERAAFTKLGDALEQHRVD